VNFKVNVKRLSVVAGVTAGAMALVTSPAFAGENAHAASYSISAIGTATTHAEAYFYHDGDNWKVCDRASDGHRAKMALYWDDSAGNHVHYLSATGGKGSCESGGEGVNIPEGVSVHIQVWHQDGANGNRKDVANGYGVA
jgi:hypothetical protein